jgi:hypothetical protein
LTTKTAESVGPPAVSTVTDYVLSENCLNQEAQRNLTICDSTGVVNTCDVLKELPAEIRSDFLPVVDGKLESGAQKEASQARL